MLSPEAKARHQEFLIRQFARDVHRVTEWRDGAVYRTKKVGTVVAFMDNPPFRVETNARLVPR